MLKLIRSNLTRITKSKTFWICSAVYLAFCLSVAIYTRQYPLEGNFKKVVWEMYSNSNPCFTNLGYSASPATGIIVLLYVSIIVGADLRNGTIRNQIIVGHSKTSIYLSNLFACLICIAPVNLAYLLLSLFTMPSETFTPTLFVWIFFNNILTILLYISLYILLMTTTKNTIATLICGSGLTACFVLISQTMIHDVLSGSSAYELLLVAFFPTGYDTLIANGFIRNFEIYIAFYDKYVDVFKPLFYLFPLISICMSALTTTAGIALFKKSNLK
ncbi:MAG: hypothetical protein K2M75_05575 [Clostridia bacterium]|nr:hypothetical protein [Clostridia bacterium]